MSIDLSNLMDKMSIKCYTVNNDLEIETTQLFPIVNVTLNFYQLWSLFGEIPLIKYCNTGPIVVKEYSWKIEATENHIVFAIVGYSDNLLQTQDWVIMSNTNDPKEKRAFLTHLSDAVECYNLYYRETIESEPKGEPQKTIESCRPEQSRDHVPEQSRDALRIKKELSQLIPMLSDL
jgi:hypothetical protein